MVPSAVRMNVTAIRPNTTGTSAVSPTAPITSPYTMVQSDPTLNAIVKYSAYEASRVDGGAMSASSAWSWGLSANENRPMSATPSHSPTMFVPAARNTRNPTAPPTYTPMITGLRPTRSDSHPAISGIGTEKTISTPYISPAVASDR